MSERTPRFDVTSFGEPLLRLGVLVGHRLADATSLDVHVGGAELNVVSALAAFGRRCAWHGAVPDGPLGELVIRRSRAAGVEPRVVVVPGSRLGTYYTETATPPRPSRVFYDRGHAAIRDIAVDDLDLDALLDTRMLHLTGITPALGDGCAAVVEQIVAAAVERGVPISFDVNHRALLWGPERAGEVLGPIVERATIVLCPRLDAAAVLGIDGEPDVVVDRLAERTGAAWVVVTDGSHGAVGCDARGHHHRVDAVEVEVIDRIGAGDAFAAGIVDGYLEGDLERGMRVATLASALALTQHGDALVTSATEIADLLAHTGGDIVR